MLRIVDSTKQLDGYAFGLFCRSHESRSSHSYSSKFCKRPISKLNLIALDGLNDCNSWQEHVGAFAEVASSEVSALFRGQIADGDRLVVDYSSMPKAILAEVVSELDHLYHVEGLSLVCDFVYSHAEYSAPLEHYGPIVFNNYITPYFVGSNLSAAGPTSVILGVGYERDVALGVIEEQEPRQCIIFRPCDHDPQYTKAIDDTNLGLFELFPARDVVEYSVNSPAGVYNSLCSVVRGLERKNTRPVVIPLGPKIFSLCALLACCSFERSFSVWRVESDSSNRKVDRIPNGNISITRVKWGDR
ncbi:hypothetical protein [Thalassobacterium sedimentorum]|nr:hypothetical protein [Coraliomargarita sp. SDUM461004]